MVSTALLAISATAIVPSNIFVEVIALAATSGKSAVPAKSPANFNFPFVEPLASAMVAPAIATST